ncbi:hypothetical protein GQ457_12G030410 [Hibiscus cannabinus]
MLLLTPYLNSSVPSLNKALIFLIFLSSFVRKKNLKKKRRSFRITYLKVWEQCSSSKTQEKKKVSNQFGVMTIVC